MDYDIFQDPSRPTIDVVLYFWDYFYAILELILILIGSTAAIFFMVIYLKFIQLQTVYHWYIFHYMVCYIIYCCKEIGTFIMYTIVSYNPTELWFCFLHHIDQAQYFGIYIFAALPGMHWYLEKTKKLPSVKNGQFWFITTIYLLLSTIAIFYFVICYHHSIFLPTNVLLTFYLILSSIIIIVSVLTLRSKLNDKYRYLVVISALMLSGAIPLLILSNIIFVFEYGSMLRVILVFCLDIPNIFNLLLPMIVLILLGRWDNRFNAVYKMIYHRKDKLEEDEAVSENEDNRNINNFDVSC